MDVELKNVLGEIKDSVAGFSSRISALQTQVDAIDSQLSNRIVGFNQAGVNPLQKALEESVELKRLQELGKGTAVIRLGDLSALQSKTTITSGTLGSGTPGVLMPAQTPGIIPGAQRRLFVRDVLRRSTTTQSAVFFIKETGFTNAASPQAGGDGGMKGESALTFSTATAVVNTIAHWIPMSKQALDDLSVLSDYVSRKLLYGLRYIEDWELLFGDGTSGHALGLCTQAARFNTNLLKPSNPWQKVDLLRRALEQVELADETPAGFFVLSPADWSDIELQKSSIGEYLIGDPRSNSITPNLWGRPCVITTAMQPGNFLCGSSESCELVDRLDAIVEVSFEDRDNFIRNLATVRAEERCCLLVFRPAAFVYGSMTSSPA